MSPIKIIKNQGDNLFVFAQMNAVHCIGEQDQKKYWIKQFCFAYLSNMVASYMQRQNITTRFLYIFIA